MHLQFFLPVPCLPGRPRCEFPSPFYAADERADHAESAAQHLARGCVSPQVIWTHKIIVRLVPFPQADAKTGLADMIRHAHVVQPGVETEAVALLRVNAQNEAALRTGLTRFTAFPAFGLSRVRRGSAPRQL